MKKTNNSNPLKYFNDAAASRKKSVNTGNDKLVKAQVGVVAKNDNDKYDAGKKLLKKYLTDPINASGSYKWGKGTNANAEAYKQGHDTTNMKWVSFENRPNYGQGKFNISGIPVGPSDNNYQRKDNKKTGGAIKSKKK